MNVLQTRRQFLSSNLRAAATAAVFPNILPASVLGREGSSGPNGRVQVACIGVGPQGRGVMSGFLGVEEARVVAVCDVAEPNLEEAWRQVTRRQAGVECARYRDFREVLARKDIDLVSIATPDHWHVPIALAAAKAGKDIYLEKPMGLTVADDLALRAAVKAHGCRFQFGTQQRSSGEFLKAVEWVRSGRIGRLKSIHVWSPASRPGGGTAPVAVPKGWDFPFWLGPAPEAPCTEGLLLDEPATGAWKTWWYRADYALGFIAGWGVHPLDIASWGHPGMWDGPMTVEGRGLIPESGACNTAIAWDVHFRFSDGVTMRFKGTPNAWEGANELNDLKEWRERYGGIEGHGTAFEGTDGWICVHRGSVRTQPARLSEEPLSREGAGIRRSTHHQRDLVLASRSRGETVCPIDESVRADVLCHLSDLAIRVGGRLTWNPAEERFAASVEANRRLERRPMRKPWDQVL